MSARSLVSVAILIIGCRDTAGDQENFAGRPRPAEPDSSVAISAVLRSIAHFASKLPSCRVQSAPTDWKETELQTARARIALPGRLQRVSRPDDSSFLDAWHSPDEQVIATAHRDSMSSDAFPSAPACALHSPDGGAIVSYRTFRPRASSPDSIYGGRALFTIDSVTVLEVQVSAIGRASFEALLPVLATLRREPPQ